MTCYVSNIKKKIQSYLHIGISRLCNHSTYCQWSVTQQLKTIALKFQRSLFQSDEKNEVQRYP